MKKQCVCGSEEFVYWLDDQQRFSTRCYLDTYDMTKHPRAVCFKCCRSIPRKLSKHLSTNYS